jgi:hypothetical protein
MNEDRKLSGVNDVRAAYRAQATPMSDAERAWIDQAIDEGLASPPFSSRDYGRNQGKKPSSPWLRCS